MERQYISLRISAKFLIRGEIEIWTGNKAKEQQTCFYGQVHQFGMCEEGILFTLWCPIIQCFILVYVVWLQYCCLDNKMVIRNQEGKTIVSKASSKK